MPKDYEALLNISRDIRSQSMVWRKQRNSAFATSNDLYISEPDFKKIQNETSGVINTLKYESCSSFIIIERKIKP